MDKSKCCRSSENSTKPLSVNPFWEIVHIILKLDFTGSVAKEFVRVGCFCITCYPVGLWLHLGDPLREIENKSFSELKEIAEKLAIKNIHKPKYNRIKAMMDIHQTRAYDLADYLGNNPQTVSSCSTNTPKPRLDELYAIAAFFRCDPSELLN